MTAPDDTTGESSNQPKTRDELTAAVEEKTAAAQAAEDEPIVNAARPAPRDEDQGEVVAERGGTATPVVAPAPIAEPGSPTGTPAGQPEPPSTDPAEPSTPQAPDEADDR
ncbi:hypothetical protein [Geodermatophilus sp. DSM 44513]|uniref:hypothetical protein n=1 Tax=Geodermatophilus sp. DSM 44513 TaxID=1528104 RepID=UPI001278B09B|nr:hypothetical protein [Geodermatophilus sp. DSM 44513]WNV74572.1 hypothetical protein RTG05_16480 [Geodermatophilus sp. DSM 44513]